jgi:hypothetical protein
VGRDALYEGMHGEQRWPLRLKDGRGRHPPNDAPSIPAGFLERAATAYSDRPEIIHLSGESTLRRLARIARPRLALAVAAEISDSRKCLAPLPSAGER